MSNKMKTAFVQIDSNGKKKKQKKKPALTLYSVS